MRKRIQLRGISRTPSDRMTADGGCSESLNVQLEDTEIAPVLAPEDITSRYGDTAAAGLPGPALFIHKGRSYNNLVFLDLSSDTIKAYTEDDENAAMLVYALQSYEQVKNVTSVGNTLVITTNQRTEYVLFKEGEYIDKGDQIPIPAVEFVTRRFPVNETGGVWILPDYRSERLIDSFSAEQVIYNQGAGTGKVPGSEVTHYYPTDADRIKGWSVFPWEKYLRGDDSESAGSYNEVVSKLWDLAQIQIYYAKQQGYFVTPVFARSAVRLFDGSYIYQSVPVLVGASDKEFLSARGYLYNDNGSWRSDLLVELTAAYQVKAYLRGGYDLEGWEDIVSSIDIFLSTDIHNPLMNAKITGIRKNTDDSVDGQRMYYDILFNDEEEDLTAERIREEVLSKSVFFKVASFDSKNTDRLVTSGYDLMSRKEFSSQDYLVTQPTLPDDYLSANRKLADNLFRYNNKVIMTGITQEITPGYAFVNGFVNKDDISYITDQKYTFRFYLRDPSNNILTVVSRDYQGNIGISGAGPNGKSVGFAWIAYPDTRCFRVDVKLERGEDVLYQTYNMEAHPRLNCAFAFIGMNKQIGIDGGETLDPGDWSTAEERTYKEDNVIWASLMDNPFNFPVSGRLSFFAEVIALANATIALSEGQFGQYPIYVFTKDGIWSVPVSDEGNFAASVPLSRDVLVSKDAIQPIEQAIVFVSAQGVMLLQGSSVTCISENMAGENFDLPDDLVTLLGGNQALAPYEQAYTSAVPFNQFIKYCRIAYDYSGRRLLFFAGGVYAYVYRLTSQTWHKLSLLGQSMLFDAPLNSYPDCWIGMTGLTSGRYKVYDFSVEYDGSPDQQTLPGLIVSRPFDLDEPDVRKAVTALRIRGKFNRPDAKYVLLGSMDGIHWGILRSLRGGSYRLFRIAVLDDLRPEERITWIDVEYETRFANRMR